MQEGIVVGAGVTDGQAAGLMVAGDNNQGFGGMLFIEGQGFLYRLAKGQGVGDGGAGVVGVAGPCLLYTSP